jgi:hypothetical protein
MHQCTTDRALVDVVAQFQEENPKILNRKVILSQALTRTIHCKIPTRSASEAYIRNCPRLRFGLVWRSLSRMDPGHE